MSVRDLIPILQVAIGPVILISGVGLLLLCMTNRFARIVDRSRQLAGALHVAPESGRALIASQLEILSVRARLVRLSILMAALAVLLAAILIIFLFLTALIGLEAPWLLATLFIGCMACLIVAVVVFIRDINLSLAALKLELDSSKRHPA